MYMATQNLSLYYMIMHAAMARSCVMPDRLLCQGQRVKAYTFATEEAAASKAQELYNELSKASDGPEKGCMRAAQHVQETMRQDDVTLNVNR